MSTQAVLHAHDDGASTQARCEFRNRFERWTDVRFGSFAEVAGQMTEVLEMSASPPKRPNRCFAADVAMGHLRTFHGATLDRRTHCC